MTSKRLPPKLCRNEGGRKEEAERVKTERRERKGRRREKWRGVVEKGRQRDQYGAHTAAAVQPVQPMEVGEV